MIRRPMRPLARVLSARAEGRDPDLIEAEERAARLAARHRAERVKAETRLMLLGLVFVLGFSTVAGRMALLSAAVPVEPRAGGPAEPIHAQRADIVDRNGLVLATNIVTASLYAQPAEMIDPRRRGRRRWRASSPTSTPTGSFARFTDGRKFVWIKRTISPEQRQRVHDLGEPGLLFGPREARLYPNGPVAAHVLGGASFGREGVHAAEVIGTAGVERVFDARLRDPGRTAEPLRLSLDLGVQSALEEVLAAGMAEMRAEGRLRHPDGGRDRGRSGRSPACRTSTRTCARRCRPAATRRRARSSTARRRGATSSARPSSRSPWRWRSTPGLVVAADHGRHQGPDALGPLHHPRLPRLRAAADASRT